MSEEEPSPTQLNISVEDRTGLAGADVDRWATLASNVLVAEGVAAGALDILFVSVEDMAILNQEHMGSTGATDVLAFPLDAPHVVVEPERPVTSSKLEGVDVHLGDIVICSEVAENQAADHAGTVEAELSLLVIHAVLHILGHDHVSVDERRTMQSRERVHMEAIGFSHPEAAAL